MSANPTTGWRPPVPPMNSSVPPGRTLSMAKRATCSGSQRCASTLASRFVEVEVREWRVVGTAAREQQVVDRRRQLVEEPTEPVEVEGVEGRDAGPELDPDIGAGDQGRVP